MRKIDNNIINAFLANKNFIGGNTAIMFDGGDFSVTLYDTTIAKRRGDTILINHGGFVTNVTFKRLNIILRALHYMRLIPKYQVKIDQGNGYIINHKGVKSHFDSTLSLNMG